MNKKVLVTGAAGFIGFYITKKLIKKNFNVVGIDNLNNYYDINLKKSRIQELDKIAINSNRIWKFAKGSIENNKFIKSIFSDFIPDIVINLAAQAGVRHSISNPNDYITSNLVGFSNILEACRNFKVNNFLFASSSSVYGNNNKMPFKESHNINRPLSLYAATKSANELMAHSYSHLFNIPTIGLRFFTVYGPWGRPDMAPMIFAKSILNNAPIKVFNNGNMKRDFTFVEDISESIYRCCLKPPTREIIKEDFSEINNAYDAPYKIFNIGNNSSINLINFIDILENELGVKAIKEYLPMQQGDVEETFADSKALEKWIKYKPKTELKEGIKIFSEWYKNYYKFFN